MAGLDELSRKYSLSNWQGGVISGARYAFRALKVPLRQVRIYELRGQFSSGDVSALSSAAALAVCRLLAGQEKLPVDLAGWKVEMEFWPPRPPIVETTSQGAEVVPSALESGHELAENTPRVS